MWPSDLLETVSHMHAHRAVVTKLSSSCTRLQLAGPTYESDTEPPQWSHNMGRDQHSDSRDNLNLFVSLISSKQCQILPLWRSSFHPAVTAYLKSNKTANLHPYTRPVIIGRDRLAVQGRSHQQSRTSKSTMPPRRSNDCGLQAKVYWCYPHCTT